MARCGVCGGKISRTLVPHGVICEDDRKGGVMGKLLWESRVTKDMCADLSPEDIEQLIEQLNEAVEQVCSEFDVA